MQPHRLRFAGRLPDQRVSLEFGDIYTLLRADNLVLYVRKGRLPNELLALHLGRFLRLVGFLLFLGDLAVGLRLHQLRRWIDVAD